MQNPNSKKLQQTDIEIRDAYHAMRDKLTKTSVERLSIRCGQFGFSALDDVHLLNEGWYVLLTHPENIKRLREEDRVACYSNRVKAKGEHKFFPSYNDNPIIADLSVSEIEVHALRLDDNGDIRTEAGITKLIFSH